MVTYDSGRHELHVEGDCHVVSDENAAGLKCSVPGEAEIFAVNLGGCRQSNARVAPGIFAFSRGSIHGEYYAAGYSVDTQIAGDCQLPLATPPNGLGLECELR